MSTQSLERTLPHNIDAEKSVLGAILVNNENYYRVLENLRAEDFYLDAHRVIYRKMMELIERSRAIARVRPMSCGAGTSPTWLGR